MNSGRTPEEYRQFFAEILAEFDARLRVAYVALRADALTLRFEKGNPVFEMPGCHALAADFSRRWIPDHPVPLKLARARPYVMRLCPTTGNRVRVSFPRWANMLPLPLVLALWRFARLFHRGEA